MAVYCKNCGARTDIRKAKCPVCCADQRKRRAAFFLLPAGLLVCAAVIGLVWANWLHDAKTQSAALTEPAAYTAQAVLTAAPPDVDTVYITIAGTKYHRDGCSHLSDTRQAISLSEALRLGYEPCADCFGEP